MPFKIKNTLRREGEGPQGDATRVGRGCDCPAIAGGVCGAAPFPEIWAPQGEREAGAAPFKAVAIIAPGEGSITSRYKPDLSSFRFTARFLAD